MRTISGRRRGRGRDRLVVTASIAALGSGAIVTGAIGVARAQAPPSPWQCLDAICERTQWLDDALGVELQSRRDGPVWIELDATTLSNLTARPPLPWRFRLEPGETRSAGKLVVQDPLQPHARQMRWTALAGDPDARHDDRWRYCMPFGGSSPVEISQGYQGEPTHQGRGAYALDFPMPIGTPVLAARAGTVVGRPRGGVEGETQGDAHGSDNPVVIEHDDGTFAMYAHLRRGETAHPGQRVACGERVGLSGDTGRATDPHLHFEVYRIVRDGHRQTIPVRFWDGTSDGFEPQAGRRYAPGCTPPRSGTCEAP